MQTPRLTLSTCEPDETIELGRRLGGLLVAGDVVALVGDLGAGKTCLVQGIARGWGALDPVSSPTYVIVNEYRRPGGDTLFHLDAYRLQDALEAEAVDFERMLVEGPLVIEWPERIKAVLPGDHLWISLVYTAVEHRTMLLSPQGKRYEKMVEKLRQKLYGAF